MIGPRRQTMRREDNESNWMPGTEYSLLSHSDTDGSVRLSGQMVVEHSVTGDQSWHNYEQTFPDGDLSGHTHDGYIRSNSWGTTGRSISTPHGADRPLFVQDRSGSEGNPRTSKVHYLAMAKESRAMMPTMLGVAQFDAAQRGHTLKPSDDLSRHSLRIVNKLDKAGVTKKPADITPNELDFYEPIETHSERAMHKYLGYEHSTELSAAEMARGKRGGRAIVRSLKPPRSRSESFTQGTLPGI